ncbi:B12-binding domain-containing radical SAM protein [Patescibacteria group bacterium]
MKILLVNPNQETNPMIAIPAGFYYSLSQVPSKKHTIKLSDLTFSNNPYKQLADDLFKFRPQLIAISIRNISPGLPFIKNNYINHYQKIIKVLKKYSKAEIIIGGSGFSQYPEEILNFFNLKFGIVGEGELAFNQFVEYLEGKKSVQSVSSLVYFDKQNKYKINQRKFIHNLDTLKLPAFEMINFALYKKNNVPIPIQTKRGCAFNCIYCNYPFLEGNRYRLKTTKRITSEIKKAIRCSGYNYIFFVDSVFTYPPHFAYQISKAIVDHKLNIKWQCFANPRGITEKLVKQMKLSGCDSVILGLDSCSTKMLIKLHKDFTKKMIAKAVSLFEKYHIDLTVDLILGGPGETLETVKETYSFLEKYCKNHSKFITIGISVFNNTEMFNKYKLSSKKSDIFYEPPTYISPVIEKSLKSIQKMYLSLPNCGFSIPLKTNLFEKLKTKSKKIIFK